MTEPNGGIKWRSQDESSPTIIENHKTLQPALYRTKRTAKEKSIPERCSSLRQRKEISMVSMVFCFVNQNGIE